MQRLVFTNANGVSIDLTKEPYGITKWTGFANANLNIQSQQVPFHDGAVFLDALISERSLSVTLAINDGNDLEKRYELRRELISALNPKLGEGVLVYTNDFISKQIKCVPKIPLFDTHNSNTKGTPKASLAWTACEPYWEDTEDTTVFLKNSIRTLVENNGDVPCQIKVDLISTNMTNPQIKSFTNNKKIKLNGTFNNYININTNFGEKSVSSEKLNFKSMFFQSFSITYSETLGLFIATYQNFILRSSDAINWISAYVIDSGSIYCSFYSENLNLFICGGSNGKIFTSSDAINWEIVHNNENGALFHINYIEELNLFIAFGEQGLILTSSDCVTWTKRETGITGYISLNSLIYAANLIVVVGNQGTILTSSDGITWTKQEFSFTNAPFSHITYSEDLQLFVAVGYSSGYRVLASSSDGINWNIIPSTSSMKFNSVEYFENINLFVAVGSQGAIYTSSDGENWIQSESGTTGELSQICYVKDLNLFVANGFGGVTVSSNCSNWEKTSELRTTSINYIKNLGLFVGGTNGQGICFSSDGITWRNELVPITTSNLIGVCYSEYLNLFVTVGGTINNGQIFTSPDAINWTKRNDVSKGLNSVTYSKKLNLFVAVGLSGIVVTSSDGINWTEQNPLSDSLKCVCYSEEKRLFVICKNWPSIYYSSDGINWTGISVGSGLNFNFVTYSENLGLFIMVGQNGKIFTSPDAINWTERNSGTNEHLLSVTCSKNLNLVVAVGANGTILISSDGINWTEQETQWNYALHSITYSETLGLFAVTFIFGILTSSDAINWVMNETSGNVEHSTHSNNLFLFVGNSGSFVTSYFEKNENIIDKLSEDSDMGFSLDIGENIILSTSDEGFISGQLTYRQKYLGV